MLEDRGDRYSAPAGLGGRGAATDRETGMGKRVDPFDRQKHLAEIPVVDSSAVDEIPDGLVLLPAPPPVSRWRGFMLGGAALLMAAGALTIAVIGAEPSRQVGEPPLRAAHESVLAASEVSADRRGAHVAAATPGTPAAAGVTTPGSAPSRTPTTARTEPAATASEDPLPGDPSATTASSLVPSEGGGQHAQDAVEEEQATTASQSPAAAPESPADDGQPGINLPDPLDTVEDVGGIVDDVTDALPIPPVLGD